MKLGISLAALAGFLLMAPLTGCKYFKGGSPVIKDGSMVKINYTLHVDGKVIDSSNGRPPLGYKQGSHQIIPGLEKALAGLKKGDKKQVVVPPEEGYGPIDPKAVQKIPSKSFKDFKNMKPGMKVRGRNGNVPVEATVVAINAKDVTLDFNHPLAGKTLNFDVDVVEVTNP